MMIKEIILHCSATVEGKPFTVADIDRFHKANGWSMVGYNYVICLDGTIQEGRPLTMKGAHTAGHNSNSIGICYIGGVDKHNKPKDTRTEEQKKALCDLVYSLLDKYHLTIDNIHCHYEFANKACPSFKRETFINEYLEYLNKKCYEKH